MMPIYSLWQLKRQLDDISTLATHMMNNKFRDAVTQDTIKDDDMLFYWCISSASMSQDCADKLLKNIVNKWITIRGFSFAKTMLKIYNKERNTEVKSS